MSKAFCLSPSALRRAAKTSFLFSSMASSPSAASALCRMSWNNFTWKYISFPFKIHLNVVPAKRCVKMDEPACQWRRIPRDMSMILQLTLLVSPGRSCPSYSILSENERHLHQTEKLTCTMRCRGTFAVATLTRFSRYPFARRRSLSGIFVVWSQYYIKS